MCGRSSFRLTKTAFAHSSTQNFLSAQFYQQMFHFMASIITFGCTINLQYIFVHVYFGWQESRLNSFINTCSHVAGFRCSIEKVKIEIFGILDSIRHIQRSYFSVLVTKQVHKESERERIYHKNKHVWIQIYNYIFIVYIYMH